MARRENRSARPAVLDAAIRLARRGGLDGFSVSDLGGELGVSKSCVYRHFESREQLAAEAMLVYADALVAQVTRAAAQAPRGLRRLLRMLEVWLGDYVMRGGCLILRAGCERASRVGAGVGDGADRGADGRPGALAGDPVSDSVARAVRAWRGLLASQLREAARLGEIGAEVDHQRLTFELFSFALGVQHDHLFLGEPLEFRHAVLQGILARHGIRPPGAAVAAPGRAVHDPGRAPVPWGA